MVSGVITRYEVDMPVAYSADPSRAAGTLRKLEMSVDIKVMNKLTDTPIMDRRGIVGPGQYAESAEQSGRKEALLKIVQEVIRGVQSQW